MQYFPREYYHFPDKVKTYKVSKEYIKKYGISMISAIPPKYVRRIVRELGLKLRN